MSNDMFTPIPGIAMEYLLRPELVYFQDCANLALTWQARMPRAQEEVDFALGVLPEDHLLWVQTNQSHTAKDGGTAFAYTLTLVDRPILPALVVNESCEILHVVGGQVQPLQASEIKAIYDWWTPHQGSYHNYAPFRLLTAVQPGGARCKVFVPVRKRQHWPDQLRQRCLLLRKSSEKTTTRENIRRLLILQQAALARHSFRPTAGRLQNQDRSLPPIAMNKARLVPSLTSGQVQLILSTASPDNTTNQQQVYLEPDDFRPLVRGPPLTTATEPTPASLLATSAATSFLATTGRLSLH